MSTVCPLFKQCAFLNAFRGQSEVIKENWVVTFCENETHSVHCERRLLEQKTGSVPAPNLSPTGKLLFSSR
ncbi:hypothetical protein [uncultured Thiocystis sp.]|jgi:hypothetical protein|uniref:hypothetical protein n=1 Tax=uncultured Thiocystis sp. TaxID=1202134 RepID=UPI0025E2FA01|nr:hypothetical protein [uncultured Thiocystis sp.]